jgi:hypothetical protein
VKQNIPRRAGVPVYMIVVPKKGPVGADGRAALARAAMWQQRIADARIVPYPDIAFTFSSGAK